MTTVRHTLLLAPLLLAFGCDATDSERETSQIINAQLGGSVELDESRLVIPGNALANDTDVTLRLESISRHIALEGAYNKVLTIEPSDLLLETSASLTLKLGGPEQQSAGAAVYHFADGAWIPMPSVQVSGGGLEVDVLALGSFAIVSKPILGSGNQIQGTVSWGNGEPVGGVPIALLSNGSLLSQTETVADGSYRFADLSPGLYTVAIDFECQFEAQVEVNSQNASIVDIPLCQ